MSDRKQIPETKYPELKERINKLKERIDKLEKRTNKLKERINKLEKEHGVKGETNNG